MISKKSFWKRAAVVCGLLLTLVLAPQYAMAEGNDAAAPTATKSDALPAAGSQQQTYSVVATAMLGDNGSRINSGLVWRVYQNINETVAPALVTKSIDPAPQFRLPPGDYVLQAAYGYASTSKRIHVQDTALTETLVINAGALKLSGTVGGNPIPSSQISFAIYVAVGADTEGRLILSNAKPGDVIRLPTGPYHVVSTFGDANAIQRADLKVETGQITEAVLNHRAAVVTLKLVATPGSEAFADTAFSVLTPGGDVVREAIGAFPQVALAEGEYVLIARHDSKVYSRNFKVEAGPSHDIEIVEGKDQTGNAQQ